jgi:hypothetical protein
LGRLGRFLDRISFGRFAARLMKAIREAGETDELRFDPAEECIVRLRDGKVVGVLNLANIYVNYRRLPRACRAEFIRICVRTAMAHHRELPDEFEAASHDLRLRLWPRAAVEQERLRNRLSDQGAGLAGLPYEPIGEHLLAFLAYDWPESVQSVKAESLTAWGVTIYEAMEVARRNLDESTSMYASIGEKLYCFTSGDSYDASRLTLIDRILGLEIAGKPVAMVPTREQLYITGSDDELGLKMMSELASEVLGGPYSLSGVPLILNDREWSDWMPPEDHPMYPRFKKMGTQWIGTLYAEQKRLLDSLHQREGIDLFVASFSGVTKEGGEIVTYCVWGEGVDSLLPVTEKVVIMKHGHQRPVALGDWSLVMEVAGELMEPTDHYPARYRVQQIPDDMALEAIGIGEM